MIEVLGYIIYSNMSFIHMRTFWAKNVDKKQALLVVKILKALFICAISFKMGPFIILKDNFLCNSRKIIQRKIYVILYYFKYKKIT